MKKKRGKKFKVIVCGGVVLVLAGGILAGRHFLQAKKASSEGVTGQSTTTLAKMDLTDSISASGTIESRKTQTVSASVNDVTVKKIYVKVGDKVKKGDKIALFDSDSLESSLEEAQDALSEAQSSAALEIESAQEQYDIALSDQSYNNTKAAKNVKKAKKAKETAAKALQTAKNKVKKLQTGAKGKNSQELTAAKEALTKAQEAYEQAKSALETAKDNQTDTARQNKSSVTQAKSSVSNARSNQTKSVKEAQKKVEEAQESLDKCTVTAPMDGVVTTLNVSVGDTYTGGTIAELDDTSGYTITTSVDEYDISDVKKGQRVVILTEATDEDELEGVVTFVAPSTGSSSSAETTGNAGNTGNSSSDGYEVRIRLKTKDSRLKMGMTAKCSIIKEEADDVYAVPYDAVSEAQDGSYYITVVDNDNTDDQKTENNTDRQKSNDTGGQGDDAGQMNGNPADDQKGQKPQDSDSKEDSGKSSSQIRTSQITVTKGMETDYYVEISGDDLQEGLEVVVPTDKVSSGSDSSSDKNSNALGGMGGMNGGGMPDGGNMGGKGGFGGGPGGGK